MNAKSRRTTGRAWLAGALKGSALLLLLSGLASTTLAGGGPPPAAPEIDPASIVGAVTLLSSGVLMLTDRARRRLR